VTDHGDDQLEGGELSPADLDHELERGDDALQSSLRALLAPPADIEDRVTDTVTQQLIGRSSAGTALDLLGLGIRTFAWFLTDDGEVADRSDDDATDRRSTGPQDRPEGTAAP
jgi:hypothetical protein